MAIQPPSLNAQSTTRCGSCARLSTERASLAHLGFGVCSLRPVWSQMSTQATCHFTPSKWTPGAAA